VFLGCAIGQFFGVQWLIGGAMTENLAVVDDVRYG
jgi:hypothetical protein